MPDETPVEQTRTDFPVQQKPVGPLAFSLKGATNSQRFELLGDTPLVVGRALTSDLPIVHPTISRRHAELIAHSDSVEVGDLGSSNGTFLNGVRVERAHARAGDTVTFGTCEFVVSAQERSATGAGEPAAKRRMLGNLTVRHERRLVTPPRAEFALQRTPIDKSVDTGVRVPGADAGRMALKLSLLLEVSKALSGTFDLSLVLQRVVDFAFQLLEVDRVALLLMEDGGLTPRVTREARQVLDEVTGEAAESRSTSGGQPGSLQQRPVPTSIVEHAVAERIAILSDDAPGDERFGGDSVVLQKIQSVMCAPLLGHSGDVLGLLYVDNRSAAHFFEEADLDFLVAFAGIAAVAMENTNLAERLRREAVVRSSFERYFNPSLAARIAADPQAVRLGGERRRIAVLFADVRGFTPRAESLPPEEVAALLNEYFTRMVECVFAHGGTLDKFIGDALMAQWGAPIARTDDADAALQAALDMQASLAELNAEWVGDGREPLRVGIGINVGDAFAGHIGSERRLEYTVIGDTVNVASRVCDEAEPGDILITGAAAEALSIDVKLEPGEPLALRGKSLPVPVFRVVR